MGDTVQANDSMAVSPSASLAVTVAVPELANSGVPETRRALDIDTPYGSPMAVYVSVPSPPVAAGTVKAVIAWLAVHACAPTDAVPNVGVRSATTVQSNDNVTGSPSASVAVTVAVPDPDAVGVPETCRDADMLTPAGNPVAE